MVALKEKKTHKTKRQTLKAMNSKKFCIYQNTRVKPQILRETQLKFKNPRKHWKADATHKKLSCMHKHTQEQKDVLKRQLEVNAFK